MLQQRPDHHHKSGVGRNWERLATSGIGWDGAMENNVQHRDMKLRKILFKGDTKGAVVEGSHCILVVIRLYNPLCLCSVSL